MLATDQAGGGLGVGIFNDRFVSFWKPRPPFESLQTFVITLLLTVIFLLNKFYFLVLWFMTAYFPPSFSPDSQGLRPFDEIRHHKSNPLSTTSCTVSYEVLCVQEIASYEVECVQGIVSRSEVGLSIRPIEKPLFVF